jgi:hypothetical protein
MIPHARKASAPDPVLSALFERLRHVVARIDPPPALAYELGRAAFTTRALDAELAELISDSATDADALLGVRHGSAGAAVRLLTFESQRLDVELELTVRAGRSSLLGQVAGLPIGQVRVETCCGELAVPIDRTGCFCLPDLPAGRFRVHLVGRDGTPVTTAWATT